MCNLFLFSIGLGLTNETNFIPIFILQDHPLDLPLFSNLVFGTLLNLHYMLFMLTVLELECVLLQFSGISVTNT